MTCRTHEPVGEGLVFRRAELGGEDERQRDDGRRDPILQPAYPVGVSAGDPVQGERRGHGPLEAASSRRRAASSSVKRSG